MANIFDLYRNLFGGSEPQQGPQQTYDVGADTIPLSLDRTPVNDPYTGTALHQLMGKLGDIGTAVPGLVERAQLGGMNALGMRQENGDIYRSKLPVAPGIEALGDAATFATGGLASGLAPAAGIYSQAARYGARELPRAVGGLLADQAGGVALPKSGKVGSFITARENYVPIEGTPAPSFWDLPARVAAREADMRSAFPSPNIGKGTDTPLFDLSRLNELPEATHNRPQSDLPRFTPARGAPVPDHIMAQLADPQMRKRLETAFEFGVKNGGPEWLNMMPVLDRFQEIAGPQLGAERFNSLAQHIGGTTSGARPPQNVKMASYWDYLLQHGDPAITRADTLSKDPLTKMVPAQGYGSPTQGLHALNAQRLREGGLKFDSVNNPKSASFPENIWGNYQPLMIDEVMSSPKILGLKNRRGEPISSPENAGYLPTEQFLQGLAKGHSLRPAQYQASLWVGASPEKVKTYSQPLASVLEDKLRFTAKKRGQTPEEALRELVMGHRPLLSVGGGLGLGTATSGQFDDLLQDVEMPK